jgi:hypothetical protein
MDTRQWRSFACAVALLPGWAAPGSAAEPESAPSQQVTVEGHRESLERRARDFVSQITADASDESLERWIRPMCPLVAGLTAKQGEMVLARLSQIARTAGAPLGPEHCQPNLLIVVRPEPKKAIEAWRKRSAGQIFNGASSMTVRHFIETARPVRAWYDSREDDRNGVPLTGANVVLNHTAGDAGNRATVNSHASDTRIERGTVEELGAVLLIVDAHGVEHLQIGQLADYLGMVGLAKLDTGAHPSAAPTILNLFAGDASQPSPAGLTKWDEAFLRALYHTDIGARMQRSAIARSVVHDIEP